MGRGRAQSVLDVRGMRTILALMLAVAACHSSDASRLNCDEGKCDIPDDGTVKKQCTNSRINAMDEKRPHFTDKGVRWSCRDVNGVTPNSNTADDRGQEYCEYFTMLHTKGIPSVMIDEQGPVFCDAQTPCTEGTCDNSISSCVSGTKVDTSAQAAILGKNVDIGSEVTPLDPKLTAGQLEWLGLNPTAKVGECVFTSWHADIDRRITGTAKVGGYALTAKAPDSAVNLFQMSVQFNSNGAAQELVKDCLIPGKKTVKDGFMRGCTNCGGLNCVPWRKSDPSVCTMAMRIAECGCKINIKNATGKSRVLDLKKAADVALAQELFVPNARRGFTLGTWDGMDKLPSGCRYISTGDPTKVTVNGASVTDKLAAQTLVACDLNGSHITAATAKDPKEACRQTYGDDVVVHVRAPDPGLATLSCDTTKPQCKGIPWDFKNL
jgi:hypothetical protein